MATIKYWNGSAWELAIVGKQGPAGPTGPTGPAGSASLQRFRFVATGGETSLSGTDANGNTLAYTAGLEEVFLNGSALIRGQDYVATTGSSITSLAALTATDVVEILAWGVFNVSNTISNTLIDAKGDILAGSAADTVSRLAVGADNTVLTADSSTATGLKWAAPAGGGKVLQVVNATYGSEVSSSSSSYADTGLTASITPSATSSKVLVIVSQNGVFKQSSDTSARIKLLRGSTDILQLSSLAGSTASTAQNEIGSVSGSYLDSPNTTSSTTYKTQFLSTNGTSNVRVQMGAAGVSAYSSITLLEIGA